jgi:hypothetical protein
VASAGFPTPQAQFLSDALVAAVQRVGQAKMPPMPGLGPVDERPDSVPAQTGRARMASRAVQWCSATSASCLDLVASSIPAKALSIRWEPDCRVRTLLVLLTVGLLGVACGENTISTLPPVSPIAQSARSTVLLSGIGTKTVTARLGAGNFLVSWIVTDCGFNAFCSAPGDPDYGITISVGYANPTSLVPSKLTDSELTTTGSTPAASTRPRRSVVLRVREPAFLPGEQAVDETRSRLSAEEAHQETSDSAQRERGRQVEGLHNRSLRRRNQKVEFHRSRDRKPSWSEALDYLDDLEQHQ